MPTEIIVALIAGIVTMTGTLCTFVASNRKIKAEQFKQIEEYNESIKAQIAKFQQDTRREISALNDAFSNHKVELHESIMQLQFSQDKFQQSVEQRLSEVEQKQDSLASMVDAFHALDKRVTAIEVERRRG